MTKLILHIGMPKAGGVFLQKNLFRQRYQLEQYGLNYLRHTSDYSRILLTLFSDFGHKLKGNIERGYNSPEKLADVKKNMQRTLDQLISPLGEETAIISADALTNLPVPDVEAMAGYLKRYFSDIQVVAYIRPPCDFVASSIERAVRKGATLEKLMQNPPLPQYRARLADYYRVFGKDNINFRLYNRDHLHRGCIIADFLQKAGAPDALYESLHLSDREEALSSPAVFYMDSINRHFPVYADNRPNPTRGHNPLLGAMRINGERFSLPPSIVSGTLEDKDGDIRWLNTQMEGALLAAENQPEKKEAASIKSIDDFIQKGRVQALDTLALFIHKSLDT